MYISFPYLYPGRTFLTYQYREHMDDGDDASCNKTVRSLINYLIQYVPLVEFIFAQI